MAEEGIAVIWPLLRYMFADAFVEGRRGRNQVVLKAGVSARIPNSWCAVSGCLVRKNLFSDKEYQLEARAEVCQTMCHWRQWQKEQCR